MLPSTLHTLANGWLPLNWVDWLLVLGVVTGLVAGARRGLVLALGGMAAAVAAVALAVHFGPPAAAMADAHWQAAQRVAAFLQRYLPLPDGSGQIPYSPSAMQLYLRQATAQGALPQGYAAALGAMTAQAGPPVGSTTIGAYIDGALASRIVGLLGFLVVLIAGETVLGMVVRVLLGGAARRGWVGLLNGLLGAVLGAAERLVEVTALLAMMASLTVLPPLAGFAGALEHSRWAPPLLAHLRGLLPPSDAAVRSWLQWL